MGKPNRQKGNIEMKLNHKVSRINRDAFLIEETLTDGISSATLCQRNLIVEMEKMLEKTILTVMDDEQLERLKSNVKDELRKRKVVKNG